jgi:hypothetical protein
VNTQSHSILDRREFRIGVSVVIAVAVLAGAAFWFGSGLKADTSASVAPSPIGSSLTAVREMIPAGASPLGSSLTAARASFSVAPSLLGSSLTSARESASVAPSPLGSSLTAVRVFIPAGASPLGSSLTAIGKSAGSAAAGSASLENMRERKSNDLYPQSTSLLAPAENLSLFDAALSKSLADGAERRFEQWYGKPNATSSAAGSASLAVLAERWAPFYAGLDKALRDAGERP